MPSSLNDARRSQVSDQNLVLAVVGREQAVLPSKIGDAHSVPGCKATSRSPALPRCSGQEDLQWLYRIAEIDKVAAGVLAGAGYIAFRLDENAHIPERRYVGERSPVRFWRRRFSE